MARYGFGFEATNYELPGNGFDLGGAVRDFARRVKQLEAAGYTVTGRGRLKNANFKVGGKDRSQHLLDLAADVRTRNLTQMQVEELLRRARGLGLVAVDETKKTAGTGPHVHLQMFRAGTVPASVYRQIGVQIQETP